MSGAQRPGDPWHLDKRVPLALIFTIMVQTAGIIWWAAGIQAQIIQHSKELVALNTRDAAHDGEARRIAEYLARLDERLAAQNATLLRVDARLHQARPP